MADEEVVASDTIEVEITDSEAIASKAMDVEMTDESSDPATLAENTKNDANRLYAAKDYKAALAGYTKCIKLCPNVAKYYGNRSACHMMLYRYRDALTDAKRCLELDPKASKVYSRVVKCCLILGEVIEAETFLEKKLLVDSNSETSEAERRDLEYVKEYMRQAEVAYTAKDYRKVVYCMDRCCSISTFSTRFKITKAECLALLGRYEEAQELANDVFYQDRTNVDATYVRGLCFYYQDNPSRAFVHFQEVLRLAPDHTKALEMYKKAKLMKQKTKDGCTAFKAERYQEAYDLYTEALTIDPLNKASNAKLHFNKATVAAKLGKFNESISECTEAIKLDENYLNAILRRAMCFMELQHFESAVSDYQKALKIDNCASTRASLNKAKKALRKSKRTDYYKILGVTKTASIDDIKRAYKKRALVHHPDRHVNATEAEKKAEEKKFKEVSEAYTILSDPKRRSRYDNGADLATFEEDSFEAFFNGLAKERRGYAFNPGNFPGFTF